MFKGLSYYRFFYRDTVTKLQHIPVIGAINVIPYASLFNFFVPFVIVIAVYVLCMYLKWLQKYCKVSPLIKGKKLMLDICHFFPSQNCGNRVLNLKYFVGVRVKLFIESKHRKPGGLLAAPGGT